jgi:hypothetical protein
MDPDLCRLTRHKELEAEIERLAATSSAVIATLRMQRDEARAENERLRRNMGLCARHLLIIEGSLPERYACRLCGASEDEDHRAECELLCSRAILRAAAAPPVQEKP